MRELNARRSAFREIGCLSIIIVICGYLSLRPLFGKINDSYFVGAIILLILLLYILFKLIQNTRKVELKISSEGVNLYVVKKKFSAFSKWPDIVNYSVVENNEKRLLYKKKYILRYTVKEKWIIKPDDEKKDCYLTNYEIETYDYNKSDVEIIETFRYFARMYNIEEWS
jgi:hypothetical protein